MCMHTYVYVCTLMRVCAQEWLGDRVQLAMALRMRAYLLLANWFLVSGGGSASLRTRMTDEATVTSRRFSSLMTQQNVTGCDSAVLSNCKTVMERAVQLVREQSDKVRRFMECRGRGHFGGGERETQRERERERQRREKRKKEGPIRNEMRK